MKLKKYYFFSDAIDSLGHVIVPGRLHVAKKSNETIRTVKYPTNTTALRSFPGLCNVYRRFVSKFSRKAAPLNKLLKKGQPTKFDLDKNEKVAVNKLKTNLINPPILALPKEDAPFTIETYACDRQVGCVLLQPQQDDHKDLRPIGY